jgi:hypothetical protein
MMIVFRPYININILIFFCSYSLYIVQFTCMEENVNCKAGRRKMSPSVTFCVLLTPVTRSAFVHANKNPSRKFFYVHLRSKRGKRGVRDSEGLLIKSHPPPPPLPQPMLLYTFLIFQLGPHKNKNSSEKPRP